jgi:hypothetical protein
MDVELRSQDVDPGHVPHVNLEVGAADAPTRRPRALATRTTSIEHMDLNCLPSGT